MAGSGPAVERPVPAPAARRRGSSRRPARISRRGSSSRPPIRRSSTLVSAARPAALHAAAAVPADRAVRSAADADYSQQDYPQYGQQPGQYGQQPGQYGQQPGQYGQYPQYGSTETPEGSKRSLALVGGIIGLLAALVVAVVAVLGFWKPGFFVTTKLDVSAAQSGVKQILTDESNGYGAKNVKDVKCNNGDSPTVKKGETFDCEVSIDGTKRQVTVTFQDNNGTYEVGRPSRSRLLASCQAARQVPSAVGQLTM